MNRRKFLFDCTTAALLPASKEWLETPASEAGKVVVGDSQVQVTICYGARGLEETAYEVDGVRIAGLTGTPWTAKINNRVFSPAGHPARLVSSEGSHPVRRAIFEGNDNGLQWKLTYGVSGASRITKFLHLVSAEDRPLGYVSLWKARSSVEPKVARTGIQDIAAFYRQGDRGLFVSLDFPYSKITWEEGATEVSYPPHTLLRENENFVCHSLTLGRVRLTGRERYGYDDGEVTAMDDYIQEHHEIRFKRPMLVSSSIVNRYTQVRGNVIFYTMKDQPTLSFNLDLLKQDLELMPKLRMEYYQVFPGVFDWVAGDPSPEVVHEMMDFARSQGVRMGGYSGSNYLFCPHFNQYQNTLNRPEWLMVDEDGKSEKNPFCFGSSAFVDFYAGTVVPNCRKFGFEIHCFDFLRLKPCYATHHGHPAGPESLYRQVFGLVRLIESINSVSPQMMTWSNSGNWTELLPKLAWSNSNLYLTDPFIATPWQGLNMTRLLDDARREQMVSLHNTHFLPYRFYTNCQYFFCEDSIVPDIRNFKYGALSTLAVTPNLSLGEIRPWLDQLCPSEQEEVTRFYKRWIDFVQEHYDLWQKTFQAGEDPGVGAVEIYSHAGGTHGFIFIVNPQYWGRTIEVPLDSTLGFAGSGQCEIVELYPVERRRLTAQGVFASLGTKLPIHVPAQQVLVLEVKAAPDKAETAQLYGVGGTIEPTSEGYLIKTRGPQGQTERFAVLVPDGSPAIGAARVRPDVPKQDKRLWAPTPIKLLAANDHETLFEITYRRKPAPIELRIWKVRKGDLNEGIAGDWNAGFTAGEMLRFPLFLDTQENTRIFPISDERADKLGLGPLANFLGTYIDNAFSESQETWIELKAGGSNLPQGKIVSQEVAPSLFPLSSLAKDPAKSWWLETTFYLPFINSDGMKPGFNDHPMVAVPMIRQSQLQEIKAWINKRPLQIGRYSYPRNPKLGCYYADLMGSGALGEQENTLVIYIRY